MVWGSCEVLQTKLHPKLLIFLNFKLYHALGIMGYVDKFQVLSQHQLNLVKKLGIEEQRLSLLGHHLNQMNSKTNEIKFNLNNIKCIFVGRIDEEKGFQNIISIVHRLPKNITIHVVGSYDGRFGDLEKFERLIYHGQLSGSELFHLMETCDYLLNTSIVFETFGITI